MLPAQPPSQPSPIPRGLLNIASAIRKFLTLIYALVLVVLYHGFVGYQDTRKNHTAPMQRNTRPVTQPSKIFVGIIIFFRERVRRLSEAKMVDFGTPKKTNILDCSGFFLLTKYERPAGRLAVALATLV